MKIVFKKVMVPYIVVRILCIACFLLNLISLCLCLSALILSLVAYFDASNIWSEVSSSAESLIPQIEELITNRTLINRTLSSTTTTTTTTARPIISTEGTNLATFPLPDYEQEHFNMIVYLMFYLTAAILALLGATTRFRIKKIYFLVLHVALLFIIISFNLLAWFQFRSYSPLNSSTFDDIQVLLASLFDFLVLLVGLSLLTSLILNRHFTESKQRNSISPLTSANGSNHSLATSVAADIATVTVNDQIHSNRSNSNLSTITTTNAA